VLQIAQFIVVLLLLKELLLLLVVHFPLIVLCLLPNYRPPFIHLALSVEGVVPLFSLSQLLNVGLFGLKWLLEAIGVELKWIDLERGVNSEDLLARSWE
jgi:hypothetical protein